MNILDLKPDILNIIGDYVKADNEIRMRKENDFKKTDIILAYLKMKKKFVKKEIGEAIYSQLYKNCYTTEEINEYIISRKLHLNLNFFL